MPIFVKFRFFIQNIFVINKFDNRQFFIKVQLTNNSAGISTHFLRPLSI